MSGSNTSTVLFKIFKMAELLGSCSGEALLAPSVTTKSLQIKMTRGATG